MENTIVRNGNTVNVTIVTPLDVLAAATLDGQLRVALDDEEIKLLEMDLKDMAYTSSAGLRVFMAMHQLMDKRGGKMVLKDPTEEVMGTFRITCFDDIFNIE